MAHHRMRALGLLSGVLLSAHRAASAPKFDEPIRGISYGPVPLKSQEGGSALAMDDWMADQAKPMWSPRGRGDLRLMKAMGANLVRLYGNNPENDHSAFLDEAWAEGLHVAPGMSDYPYYQMQGQSCRLTDFDCYTQVMPLYLRNLEGGFMTPGRTYHPALAYIIIINEPDLKMPPTATIGGADGPRKMCKAIISAFDAMLGAEKEAGLVGVGINFTATFSYAVCTACSEQKTRPALGQMAQLADAMLHPENYGYTPRNNITEAFITRWTNSFNTQNPAKDLRPQFFDTYETTFTTTPVFVAEYHKPDVDQAKDLATVFDLVKSSHLFYGISYFEFQVAYWKGGSEEEFGVFGLGDYVVAEMPYFGKVYSVYCLSPVGNPPAVDSKAKVVTKAFGGDGFDESELCLPSPEAVELSEAGYKAIWEQGKPERMAVFLTRVTQHLGATVADPAGLLALAGSCVGPSALSYEAAVVTISHKPAWASFDPDAVCVADRSATGEKVGEAIGWTCSQAQSFSCDNVPASCKLDPFNTADWVFSNYYKELVSVDPLKNCFFGGAAIFASPKLYGRETVGCAFGKPPVRVTIATTSSLPAAVFSSTAAAPVVILPTATTSALAAVDAFFHLEVSHVNFNLVTPDQQTALASRYASIFASALGVPAAAVRNSQAQGGMVDLYKGSVVLEGFVRGPVGVTLDGLIRQLDTPVLRGQVVNSTSWVLAANQAAITGPLKTQHLSVSIKAPPSPRTSGVEGGGTPTIPAWTLWLLGAVILALLLALLFAYQGKARKRKSRRRKEREEWEAPDTEAVQQQLLPAAAAAAQPRPLVQMPMAAGMQPQGYVRAPQLRA